jgi:hypothetical protein
VASWMTITSSRNQTMSQQGQGEGDSYSWLDVQPYPYDLDFISRDLTGWNRLASDAFAAVAEFRNNFQGFYQEIKPVVDLARLQAPLIRDFTRYQAPFIRDYSRFYASIVENFARFHAPLVQIVQSVLGNKQWQEIFRSLQDLAKAIYPENWTGVDPPSVEQLEVILVDEGIPLMWVPGPSVVQALLEAEDARSRRRIIGRRWMRIINDCEAVIGGIANSELQHERSFALDCVRAIRGGHSSAAQALAANLLDTALCHLEKDDRVQFTDNKFKQNGVRFNLDDYTVRAALTFAPVWSAHSRFFVNRGDSIPRRFGRHPSVHAVSKSQYTRINAVIAVMLVASVLKFFDVELR